MVPLRCHVSTANGQSNWVLTHDLGRILVLPRLCSSRGTQTSPANRPTYPLPRRSPCHCIPAGEVGCVRNITNEGYSTWCLWLRIFVSGREGYVYLIPNLARGNNVTFGGISGRESPTPTLLRFGRQGKSMGNSVPGRNACGTSVASWNMRSQRGDFSVSNLFPRTTT